MATPKKDSNPSFLVALGLFLAGIAGLGVYEAYAIESGKPLITVYTRRAIRSHPGITAIVVFSLGALFAHLAWDAGDTND